MTLLCASILVRDPAQARRDLALAAEAGAEIVELRLDRITDPAALTPVMDRAGVPCVLTCRPTWEGGESALDDAERLRMLESLASGRGGYVDVELKTVQRVDGSALPASASLIISAHDFAGRPERLNNLLLEMDRSPATVQKIVWTARTIRDNLEAFEILRARRKPMIAFCMGEAGIISRVLAKKFGSFLTFATIRADAATAPGQLTLDELKSLYRWDAIGPNTRVYGVVADPVMHSMSPAIHNAAFDAAGFDGVYLPMRVEGSYESFKAFMESFLHAEGLDFSGLSVTIPHKENALRYLSERGDEVEPLARRIGAVNTIIVDRSPRRIALRGINTDYAAILDSITSALQIGRDDLKDRRVAVLGAGGTGRTAVAALAHCGATVVVYNRTLERAKALSKKFNGKSGKVVAAPMEKLCGSCCDIYLNTTSVGMHPKVDQSAFGVAPPKLTSGSLVFDTVYNPMKTLLLKQAEQAGAATISGVEMFVRQAAAQFEAWTNLKAPMTVMREVIERRLGS